LLFHQQQVNLPETVDSLISYLMEYRSLTLSVGSDNGESILRSGERAGRALAMRDMVNCYDGWQMSNIKVVWYY